MASSVDFDDNERIITIEVQRVSRGIKNYFWQIKCDIDVVFEKKPLTS